MVVEPQGALKCRSSTIAVWDDSGPFLRLLLSYRGPEMISTIYEPRVVFTCRSATLTILGDSGTFRGLLLTVLCSQSDFHERRSPGRVFVYIVNTPNFGQF